MSIDYSSVAGYGVKVTEEEFKRLFKDVIADFKIEEDDDIMEMWWEFEDRLKCDFSLCEFGNSLSGNISHCLLIDDGDVDSIKEKANDMLRVLKREGIEKDKIEFISEILVW